FKILVEKGDKISKVTTDADRHAFIIFKYKGDNIRSEVENSFETLEAIYEK
ncbi:MAG: hypothetical protein JRJ49_11180, partial [Deltaproteobacteria bacterium]|nr:hypothetical protein [Deltaproteobacteria bacterium]